MSINLSIVIPHFNSPESLSALIDSIGRHDDVQIIVVDDNSTRHIDKYEACKTVYPHVQFFLNDIGIKGAGSSRNIGLKHALGDWLLFADADDLLIDGWYEAVSKYFESDFDLIYFKPTSWNTETNKPSYRHISYLNMIEAYEKSKYTAEENLRYFFSVPWSKLVRHKIVEDNQIKFDQIRYSNDEMFSTKTGFYAKSIAVDDSVIYCVMERDGTLTKNMSEEAFYIRTKVDCERIKFLREHLSKDEFSKIDDNIVLKRLKMSITRKYGTKALIKYYKLFKSYGLPIIPVNYLKNRMKCSRK